MTRFHDLGLRSEIMHAIADLGFEYCTPIQAKVLPIAQTGRNVAGRAQTGTGKTAAFLISIFSHILARTDKRPRGKGAPLALILAPTRELVVQIEQDARALGRYGGFRTLAVYGGMDFTQQHDRLQRETIDLVAGTPGRLLDFIGRGALRLEHAEILVIDEADRMLDMGFIPDVRRIVRRLPEAHQRRTMLFSATLTPEVMRLASQWMPDPVVVEVESDQVTVDKVEQIVYPLASSQKFNLLYHLLQKPEMTRVLVFANRRDGTKRVADRLIRHGVRCEMLSGDVDQKKRLRILDEFRAGKFQVLVATDVAGRGLHVENISHVINYDFPYEPEDYLHRIGRTARAGLPGTAISFACENESFIIPDIEKYIGQTLRCSPPDEAMLKPPPVVGREPASGEPAASGPRRAPSRTSRPSRRRPPRR